MSDLGSPSDPHSPKMDAVDEAPPVKKRRGRRTVVITRYAPSSHAGRYACCALAVLLLLAGITALVLYLVYRPSKPRFSIVSAAVYNLNLTPPGPTAPTSISTSMQFTVVSRNPNRRTSVYYDRLEVYVTYRNHPITPPVPLPPVYLERGSTVAVSPVVGGAAVPVAGDVAEGLVADVEGVGVVGLRVVVMGRARYRAGPFRGGWGGMFVACDAMVAVRKGVYGQVPLIVTPICHVDI